MTGGVDRDGANGEKAHLPEESSGLDRRRERLNERLDRLSAKHRPAKRGQKSSTGYAQAMRLSTEFVSAILVGAGLGWAIDRFLGTAPWAMIVFLLLGFCAGIVNVLRAAGKMADPHARNPSGSSDEKE